LLRARREKLQVAHSAILALLAARFITTHGFLHSIALEGSWIMASSASPLFGGLLVFKFGNDSVTAAAIRTFGVRRTARVSERENVRRRRRFFQLTMHNCPLQWKAEGGDSQRIDILVITPLTSSAVTVSTR
jgi:hypothetical protein